MTGIIAILIVFGIPIGFVVMSKRAKKDQMEFAEKYSNPAKLRKQTHKNTYLYCNVTDENGNKANTSPYEYKDGNTKEIGLYIPAGKYTFEAEYEEFKFKEKINYGKTNLILTFEENKEYVLKVDYDTKEYSFEEYKG